MTNKEKILNEVCDFFIASSDFNGIPITTLAEKTKVEYLSAIEILKELTKEGLLLENTSQVTDFILNEAKLGIVPFYSFGTERSNWLIGANFYSDQFKEGDLRTDDRSYEQNTYGAFVQQDLSINEKWGLESGFRLDYNDDYGWFALPRVALLYKATTKVSYRLGGGLGYKAPSIFTEDTERQAFRNLRAFNLTDLDAERSYGGNFDINYKSLIEGCFFCL